MYAVVRNFVSFVAGIGKMSYLELVIPAVIGLSFLPIFFDALQQKTPRLIMKQS